MALAHLFGTLSVPYVFGGDGMVFLLPPQAKADARDVLARAVRDVENNLRLQMRAALIPLSSLCREDEVGGGMKPGNTAGRPSCLAVSKLRVSPTYDQAVFHGEAINRAEFALKKSYADAAFARWHIPRATDNVSGNYQGFTCRWQDIPSARGNTIALVVRPRRDTPVRSILAGIEGVFREQESVHPLSVEKMRPGGKTSNYAMAAKLNAGRRFHRIRYVINRIVERVAITATRFFTRADIPLKVGLYQMNRIREQSREASDYRKFDGSFKMIFSTTDEELDALENLLSRLTEEGKIFYGLHRTYAAHMTCLAHLPSGDDVHFVDATEGGYAVAARRMKEQIRELTGFG